MDKRNTVPTQPSWYDLIKLVARLKKSRPLITRRDMLSMVDAYFPACDVPGCPWDADYVAGEAHLCEQHKTDWATLINPLKSLKGI